MDVFHFFGRSRESKAILEQHRQRLYRIAYAWTHSTALADDLVQETLAKALRKSSQLRDPSAGDAWLYSILANCYRDHFRRQRATEEVDENTIIHESTPEKESSEQEIVLKVRAAIAKLAEGQRQVVTLVDIQGLSYMEVAQILNVPIGTVMSRLCRARYALKDLLTELAPRVAADEVKLRRIK
ncbi:MAG: sigma-70 family RNA polymerase sigma factor [Gammaproteobacteria bacterium]|nr:sigma-70 family RNA polymerase sigma factor [Gammaproteobacteria bacterium]MDH3407297.1 sigma-70 family RNA polymerase sigma factor [Gammaproteobacteria bacterium]MDH5488234.1 sigma-70 family RNA polymerase sigma factor [Gammaproteobacteria bacterium]